MKKTLQKILFVTILFSFPLISFAQVVINEIMYDLSGADSDGEWVEIYNGGSETIIINIGSGDGSWRFVDNSPHILNLVSNSSVLQPNQYAIIAKSASAWSSFTGVLFTSSISLPNTAATLSIKD